MKVSSREKRRELGDNGYKQLPRHFSTKRRTDEAEAVSEGRFALREGFISLGDGRNYILMRMTHVLDLGGERLRAGTWCGAFPSPPTVPSTE